MKVLYSQLQKYIPELTQSPEDIAHVFTMIGYMQDGPIEKVQYENQEDFLIDLEVRQNRADCFSVIGLARELSAYYNLPLSLPTVKNITGDTTKEEIPLTVSAEASVKRIFSAQLHLTKEMPESPDWLVNYLALYGINSINVVVDLTNYVMLETGHPSHAFDVAKSSNHLVWEYAEEKYHEMTSLDGTKIDLVPNALVISNGREPQALAGLVGGKKGAIDGKTKDIVIEMAVYDGGLIRQNSRAMKIFTEASSRLEKFMDPQSLDEAFFYLIQLIQQYTDVELTAPIFEYAGNQDESSIITVRIDRLEQMAGIPISTEDIITYAYRLGFGFITVPLDYQSTLQELGLPAIPDSPDARVLQVKRPINRLDISLEEDVYEEIIRMKGYAVIPSDHLTVEIVKDVTPAHLNLIDELKAQLVHQGWDEVRSWAMVDETKNTQAYHGELQAITVENAINDEVPILRQTIAASMLDHVTLYNKKNIHDIHLFEVGKVFQQNAEQYDEWYALGIARGDTHIDRLQITVESLLRKQGIMHVRYVKQDSAPEIAHPQNHYTIEVFSQGSWRNVGVVYVVNTLIGPVASYAELSIRDIMESIMHNTVDESVAHLEQKIVVLDENIELSQHDSIDSYITELIKTLDHIIWKWEVIDTFKLDTGIRYTVRIHYAHQSDTEAKELHKKIFTGVLA